MDSLHPHVLIYGAPLALMLTYYFISHWRSDRSARVRLESAINSGMAEPVSMHPHIDPGKCIGCGACVKACPEGDILGLIQRKAALVSPTDCIGHGACQEACPSDAISLVFGSATRGVEIPLLSKDFETSVAGIYIAGELGGMGLIRNAIIQGRQAVEAISKTIDLHPNEYDLLIVGAGPAGLSAALEAKARKLKFAIVEQDTVGGTLAHYPRGKMVMTQPAELPLVGAFQFSEASKEDLVGFWREVIYKTDLHVQTNTRVNGISRQNQGFCVSTTQGDYCTHKVLLALGRRGTPRKLGVPGEELSKVVYRLVDAEQYIGRHVLIVGGGDSALEAAISISKQPGTSVTLCHRNKSFARAKQGNRNRLTALQNQNKIQVMLETTIVEIQPKYVRIKNPTGMKKLINDNVVICAGGLLPTPFLHNVGIQVEAKFGTA